MSELRLDEARSRLYGIMDCDEAFETKARRALELGTSYLGVESAYLSQVDPRTNAWEAIASTDARDGPFPDGTANLDTTFCRRTIDHDTSVAIHDARARGRGDDPAVQSHQIVCYHGTPITIDGDRQGVVCFVATSSRKPFTDAETMFAELLARLLEREFERQDHESALERRSMMITVLNRVLRHNLRNSMTVIRGQAQMAGDTFRWPPRELQTVIERADELIQLSEKARKLDSATTDRYERQETDILALLRRTRQELVAEYPDASVTVKGIPDTSLAVLPSLEMALSELLDNAVKHSGDAPEVTVTVEASPDSVEIEIVDSGPGLPEVERKVLTTGDETPLTHGFGLGHWLVYWVVTSHDGTISAEVSDAGTQITVRLPKEVRATPAEDSGEKGLQRVQDKFRTVFEEATDAMVLVDDDAQIIDANQSAGALFGRPATELFGLSVGTFVADGTTFKKSWQPQSADTHERGTLRLVRGDTTERTAGYTITTDIVPGEHLIIFRDITEQKARERKLNRTTERLEAVIDASPNPILCIDREGNVQMWSAAAEQTFGWGENEVSGRRLPALLDGDVDRFDDCIEAALGGEQVDELEVQCRTKDGERLDVSVSMAPIRGVDGPVFGVIAVLKDISRQKRRERELEVKTRAIEKAPVSTVITDASEPENPIIYTNEAFERLTGYTETESLGQNCRFLQGPETDTETVETMRDAIASAEPISVELLNYRRDGTTFWNETTLAPVTDERGDVTHYIGFQQDVTDRRNREEELLQVSHDLQNPLTVASGSLDMLDEKLDSEHVATALQALSRMDDLITDVLSLARQDRPIDETQSVDLSSVVDQCWRWVDADRAALVVEDEMTLTTDTSRLKQLLENLFGNALEHGGPDVTVRVGTLDSTDGFYIADNGVGIDADEQSRVFESGYSTSEDGTGLGLTIVRKVAQAHGWTVELVESEGGGARFEVQTAQSEAKSHTEWETQ